jgi:histidine ammonia-lyase
LAFRCVVPVHGALLEALDHVRTVLEIDLNASAENPLYTDSGSWHHGAFHHAGLALALDHLRLALVHAGGLSVARLSHLSDPASTGLRPFLAHGPDGASGTMVLEYTASSAMAEMRQWAAPATLGQAVVSRGVEDHASFAWQAAMALRLMLGALRSVLACELVAALRAVRLQDRDDAGTGLAPVLRTCSSLHGQFDDHALVDDLVNADAVLDDLGALLVA